MNLCMDPCLVAELIHVLSPMHLCYTNQIPCAFFWDCVSVQPGCGWFCVGVWSVVLGPVCSQCFPGGFLLLQLLQGFCWLPKLGFFPSWPLERISFYGPPLLLGVQQAPEPAWNTWICEKRQNWKWENIYVGFFSLYFMILVELKQENNSVPSWNHWWDSNYSWAAFWHWNGAQNDEITCWMIPGNVQIPGTFREVLSVSWAVSLMAMDLGSSRRNKDFSAQGLGVTNECLKVPQRILGRGISKSRFDIKKLWPSSLARFTLVLLKWLKAKIENQAV